MPLFDDLKKKIEEKKVIDKKIGQETTVEEINDPKLVDKIVADMKKKYHEQGIELADEAKSSVRELKSIVSGSEATKVSTQPVEELIEINSPMVRAIGKVFLSFQGIFNPVLNIVKKFPVSKELAFYLYSANVNYSARQYLALSVTASSLVFLLTVILGVIASVQLNFNPLFSIGIGMGAFLFSLIIILMIPRSIAEKRGKEISTELPFALRHMASELRAGIGLYKTLETIASSDYGLLSTEFKRTISEIEEGTDTQEALRHFALRTQSKSLRNALFHIIRALKTGGALSNVMNEIAEDVSFDLQLSIRDFAEKMNFFGIIFIFGGIVVPVFVAIIGTILNAPLGIPITSISLPPQAILLSYVLVFPAMLGFFIFYIRSIQPTV